MMAVIARSVVIHIQVGGGGVEAVEAKFKINLKKGNTNFKTIYTLFYCLKVVKCNIFESTKPTLPPPEL